MKALHRLLLTAALVGGVAAVPVHAASADSAPKARTAQQERMATCNKQATGKTGDARKAFMSDCLKGDTTADGKALNSSQERMKSCNADATAKGLKGDERKNFMSTCLKAK
jgi:hypothetical protein